MEDQEGVVNDAYKEVKVKFESTVEIGIRNKR